jgi:hypothetical protein
MDASQPAIMASLGFFHHIIYINIDNVLRRPTAGRSCYAHSLGARYCSHSGPSMREMTKLVDVALFH